MSYLFHIFIPQSNSSVCLSYKYYTMNVQFNRISLLVFMLCVMSCSNLLSSNKEYIIEKKDIWRWRDRAINKGMCNTSIIFNAYFPEIVSQRICQNKIILTSIQFIGRSMTLIVRCSLWNLVYIYLDLK